MDELRGMGWPGAAGRASLCALPGKSSTREPRSLPMTSAIPPQPSTDTGATQHPLPVRRVERGIATRVRPSLPALLARRMTPTVSRTVGTVAVAFAAEYGLRTAANRGLARLARPIERSSSVITRLVVTELTVIERGRRR